MERALDWLKQAAKDLQHARNSLKSEDFEWTCFAAQQSAEKAVKALFQALHAEAWGHSVSGLLQRLPSSLEVKSPLIDQAKKLDRHYIPARYPNSHPSGAPADYYSHQDGLEAIGYAEEIYIFCENQIRTIQRKD
ncbi:MAG: HEPN domain-containing protein [Candidatus Heimdallarchaeota archaeon]